MTKQIDAMVQTVGQTLKQRGWRVATAESCTGGGLSYALTELAGSSDWFERGFVTYSNTAKVDMLGVKQTTLDAVGAVSEETASEMAEGAVKHSQAEVSIAITGIAGPSGGSALKPVGTVWIAWKVPSLPVQTELNVFEGNRQAIRLQAIERALKHLSTLLASS